MSAPVRFRRLPSLAAFALSLALLVVGTVPAHAGPPPGDKPLVDLEATSAVLVWHPLRPVTDWNLRVVAPGGVAFDVPSRGAAPRLTLEDLRARLGSLPDGSYGYEVTAALDLDPSTRRELEAGRDAGAPKPPWLLEAARDLRQSGTFRVLDGGFHYDEDAIEDDETERGTTPAASSGFDALRGTAVPEATADRQTFDTTSPFGFVNGFGVRDSLCVGADCQTQEDYVFETVRLKESNLRIGFQDTTDPADPFPSRDWQILANDTTSGGRDRFSVYDVTADNLPLTIEGAAPDDAVWVAPTGRVGLGTAAPVERLHVVDGDTPSLRLEQDATQGLAARAWTVSGDEGAFAVTDATAATTPFSVAAGAASDSLAVADGAVGIGTPTPDAPLHVSGGAAPAKIHVEERNAVSTTSKLLELEGNGGVRVEMRDSKGTFTDSGDDSVWRMETTSSGSLHFNRSDTGSTEMILRDSQDGRGIPTADVYGTLRAESLEAYGDQGTTRLRVTEANATPLAREMMRLTNNGDVHFHMIDDNVGAVWTLISSTSFRINYQPTGTTGLKLAQNGDLTIAGTLTQNSNRETKTAIKAVDPSLVLDRVLELPIATWQRRGQDGVTHLGPMAQDFRALFGLGLNDTSIATLDVGGVALAAIQGLHRENEALRARVESLEALETRLEALEALLADR